MGLMYYYLWVFFMYKASYIYGSILCMTPPILHKMVPIYRVSYILLWVHLMYTDYCRVLLLYIRWSLYIVSYVLLWVHLIYTDYCRVLLLYIRWSLYIASYVLLWVHLMYTDHCGVLTPVHKRWSLLLLLLLLLLRKHTNIGVKDKTTKLKFKLV